jgi:pentamidine resistance factor
MSRRLYLAQYRAFSTKGSKSFLSFNLKAPLKNYLKTPVFAQNLLNITNNNVRNEKINAYTTLPYDLVPASKDASAIRRFMTNGKELVKLYKNGIVNVWKNNKESKAILKRLLAKDVTELTRSILEKQGIERITSNIEENNKNTDGNTVDIQVPGEGNLTRSQYQMLLKTPSDFSKLPIFSVLFAIFMECTPIIVMLVPHIVPSTCLIPRQQKAEVAKNNKNIAALKALEVLPADEEAIPKYLSRSVYHMSKLELRALSAALQLYSSLIPVSLIPKSYLESAMKTHIDQIKCDDILIGWYGGVWDLAPTELVRACQARAISTDNVSDQELRIKLFSWIVNFSQGRYDAGFFLHTLEAGSSTYNDLVDISKDF